MPRIAVTFAWLGLIACGVGLNVARYPIVSQMVRNSYQPQPPEQPAPPAPVASSEPPAQSSEPPGLSRRDPSRARHRSGRSADLYAAAAAGGRARHNGTAFRSGRSGQRRATTAAGRSVCDRCCRSGPWPALRRRGARINSIRGGLLEAARRPIAAVALAASAGV